jgi:hypothetical protein
MSRINDLDDLLFDVAERPLFVAAAGRGSDALLKVPDHRAIVSVKDQRILGVVGSDYRLVTHARALEWGRECCVEAFPGTAPDDWTVESADGPSTGSYCRIDLHHVSANLDFICSPLTDLQDAFGPFLRITNSYNRQRALRFDVGILRKVCMNGMILSDTLISLWIPHQKGRLKDGPKFQIDHALLGRRLTDFDSGLKTLARHRIQSAQVAALTFAIMKLRPPKDDCDESRRRDWAQLVAHVSALVARYTGEVGENAYALFNVLTDLATHPRDDLRMVQERHTLQRRAGAWFSSFIAVSRAPGFEMAAYVSATTANGIEEAAGARGASQRAPQPSHA